MHVAASYHVLYDPQGKYECSCNVYSIFIELDRSASGPGAQLTYHHVDTLMEGFLNFIPLWWDQGWVPTLDIGYHSWEQGFIEIQARGRLTREAAS